MDHKEREVLIGEIMWHLIESKDKAVLSEYLNNPMKEPEKSVVELIRRHYQIQWRTAKEWLCCAIYQIRHWSDIHEVAGT